MSEDDAIALSMSTSVPVCSSLRWHQCGVRYLWRTMNSLSQPSEKLSVLAVTFLSSSPSSSSTAEGASVFSFRPTGPQ